MKKETNKNSKKNYSNGNFSKRNDNSFGKSKRNKKVDSHFNGSVKSSSNVKKNKESFIKNDEYFNDKKKSFKNSKVNKRRKSPFGKKDYVNFEISKSKNNKERLFNDNLSNNVNENTIVEKNLQFKGKENQIEGRNAIIEALNAGRGFKKLFVLKNIKDEKINRIINDLKIAGTVINFMERDELDRISETKANQGIIAQVENYNYVEVDDILDYAKEKNEVPFIIILDEVEDPHNFGAIIRTAECMGAHGIIIKNRNQAMVTATVVSASAGASNYVKIARVTNLSKTIDDLKNEGFWFACADMDGVNIKDTNLNGPIGLIVGNEGNGVSRLVKEKCDFVVKIPMYGHIDSLNVSVATGIIAYEISNRKVKK